MANEPTQLRRMETAAGLRVDAMGLRTLAERMRDPSTQDCLRRLADDWDARAGRYEERERRADQGAKRSPIPIPAAS